MNDTVESKPVRKKPGRPSMEQRLRRMVARLEELPNKPTNEHIARSFNALLKALRGE